MDYILTFNITSYWHIGTGQEAAAYADALTLKDNKQLPFLPGKSIKGLLREAFQTAIENQWFFCDKSFITNLFGDEGLAGNQKQGILQISNGTLSSSEKRILQDTKNKEAVSQLYKVTFSTAINEITGVAENTSLRSMEVTIPMTLKAELNLNTENVNIDTLPKEKNFLMWLDQAVSLITELGAKRHRGLGKVIVTAKAKE